MSMYESVISGTENIDKVHKVVVSLSGGLDSTTLLYFMVKKLGRENVVALSFDYNQRHGDVELKQASKTCEKLGVKHKIINLSFLGEIAANVSAMVKGSVATPTMGDLDAEKTVPTYVPFRNTILTGITLAYAEANGADGIALGVQYGDYENNEVYLYWDCQEVFTKAMQAVADLNNKHKITFIAPFVKLKKVDEIQLGSELSIPYEDSWTCYNPTIKFERMDYSFDPMGGRNGHSRNRYIPCGICPSCAGRADSFKELKMKDPLVEQDGVVY